MTESKHSQHRIHRAFRYVASHAGVIVLLVVAVLLGYWFGGGSENVSPPSESVTGEGAADTIWTCAMHPQIRMSEPGLCPICGMELVPVDREGDDSMRSPRTFSTTPASAALMKIQTTPVIRDFADAEIRMVGKVDYDETRLAYITAWVPGRIEEMFVDFTGIRVKKGDHMVSLYSPELITAQEELWRAAQAVGNVREGGAAVIRSTAEATLNAARNKLRRWGLNQAQIDAAESKGNASDRITIYAPNGGTVIHRNGQEGMYVETGTRFYTLADLEHMWVKLDAYESDLPWLKYGQRVEFTTETYAGKVFEGRVTFIDPFLDPKTRTAKVRVNVSNEEGLLKPEMFVSAVARPHIAMEGRVMDPEMFGKWVSPMHPEIVKDGPGKCDICGMDLVPAEELGYIAVDAENVEKPLLIPVSAALVTGTRAIVYVEVPDSEQPTFEGREVVLGPRAGDQYIVMSGLSEGERVVVNGNFKIDSALQIMAKPSMMSPEGGGGAGAHDHGPAVHKPANKESTAGVSLDTGAKAEFVPLWTAHQSIETAVRSDREEAISAALAEFKNAVAAVDMGALQGDAHMVWMEYARRLENDAVEASITQDEEARNEVLAALSNNLNALGDRLGLHADHTEAATVEVDAGFAKALGEILRHYLSVQRALADDDAAAAQSAANQMAAALSQSEGPDVAAELAPKWNEHRQEALDAAASISDASGLDAKRTAFRRLTLAIRTINEMFGLHTEEPLYLVHCPMAFDGQGADWLQTSDTIHNPYFGSVMPTCGEVLGKVTPQAPVDTATDHGGHTAH